MSSRATPETATAVSRGASRPRPIRTRAGSAAPGPDLRIPHSPCFL
jgi:hypothetical protein